MIACLRFNASRLKPNRAFAHSTGRVPGRTITIAEIREKLPSGRFTDDELDNHVEALELFGSGFVSRPAGSAAYLQLNYSVMRDLARYLAVEKVGLGLGLCSVVIETWWSRKHYGWLMFVFNFLCVPPRSHMVLLWCRWWRQSAGRNALACSVWFEPSGTLNRKRWVLCGSSHQRINHN